MGDEWHCIQLTKWDDNSRFKQGCVKIMVAAVQYINKDKNHQSRPVHLPPPPKPTFHWLKNHSGNFFHTLQTGMKFKG